MPWRRRTELMDPRLRRRGARVQAFRGCTDAHAEASNSPVSRKRPAALALPIGVAIASLLAVLGVLRASAPDDEGLRTALARELERLDAWPEKDPLGKDRRIEELLAVEDYQKYARGLWSRLDRLHGPAHQAARAHVAAARAVPGFLARCRNLDALSPEELRAL